MTASAPAPAPLYRELPPEPWGRRLERARFDVAGYTLDEAAALAGHFIITSSSTISRLEQLVDPPTGPRQRTRRQLAYVLCLAYRVDPAEFGLTGDDLPPGVEVPHRSTDLSTIWQTSNHMRHAGRTRPLKLVA